MMTPQLDHLAGLAVKIACTLADATPHVAGRLARAALAGDARQMMYWLRLARGLGAAPETLVARALSAAEAIADDRSAARARAA